MTTMARLQADRRRPAAVTGYDEKLRRFGANVRATRIRRGLTQKRLACAAVMTVGEVSRTERGLRDVRILTLVKLADALDARPGDLLKGMRSGRDI